jgi:hypothetical protein
MRRLIITATGVLLLGASVAVANNGFGFGSRTIKAVNGTVFAATAVSNARTRTCTGSDGASYSFTRATYTGTVSGSSEAALNGNATIDALSIINSTAGIGTVSGRLRIDGSTGAHTSAAFDTVYSGGTVAGLAEGHTSEHGGGLVANISANFTATGGFTNGKLGGGTAGGTAVVTGSGGCNSPTTTSKPDRIEVHGTVTTITPAPPATPTSITAAGITCSVPSTLAAAVNSVHVGDSVKLECTVSGGTNTLAKIERKHNH